MTPRLPQVTLFMHAADTGAAMAFFRDVLLPRDVHGPADQPHGQSELPVRAPDGGPVCSGHPLFDARQKVPLP